MMADFKLCSNENKKDIEFIIVRSTGKGKKQQ